MATINLGAIKFNWKGAYNSGTSYAVDDVVSSGGNSYVCIQAHSNQAVGNATAYWNIMSSAGTNGTNGTDLTTTLTTQGDIVYRDGSGLQRLGYGTSGKVLTTKGSGQNPAWETAVGGKIGQVITVRESAVRSTTSASWQGITGMSASITPSATSSKILWSAHGYTGSNGQYAKIKMAYSNGNDLTTSCIGDARGSRIRATIGGLYDGGNDVGQQWSMQGLDSPNTTSATTYQVFWWLPGSQTMYLNRRNYDPDDNTIDTGSSSITLMEVLA